jgi:hypothetical protein
MLVAIGAKRMKHRSIDYDVGEVEPGKWGWTIYQKTEVEGIGESRFEVTSERRFASRYAAIVACIAQIDVGLEGKDKG